ncbi:MAG: hypothetical protein KJ063_03330 [Anaerolineae bacterium]|nr:hypothetical protein [Anaerolineae bacterium]
MMNRFVLYLFVLFAFLLINYAAAPAAHTQAQGALDSRFGAVEAFWAPNEAAELGVGWERILFYWNEIQPTGPNDWNTLHVPEEWLVEARSNGRTVVGLLKNTPTWATDGEFAAGVPYGLYLPIDDPGNLWANYARRAATYYGARGVNHWIIWNEPDIAPDVYGHEFAGSIQDYVQLLKVAYLAIKEVNPSAVIHLGGMTYWHDQGYLRRLLQAIVAEPDAAANNYYFDVVSLHIYFRPETIYTIVGNAYGVQSQVGISPLKAVWINETNARPNQDPEWPVTVQNFQIDLEQQAWYIIQAHAIGFHAGASRIAVYKLVDVNLAPGEESWGLIRPHDFSRRPAFYAYQNVIQYLAGFTNVQRERTDNYYIFTFSRPQGVTRILWARTQSSVNLNIPALSATAQLVQANGETIALQASSGVYNLTLPGARCTDGCYMGGPPIFLVEEGATVQIVPTAAPGITIDPTPTVGTPITETVTLPVTVTLTITATAEPSPTPTVTAAPSLTPTFTPTPPATQIALAATPTPVAATPVVPPAVEVEDESAAASPIGLWFLGGGLALTLGLVVVSLRRRG